MPADVINLAAARARLSGTHLAGGIVTITRFPRPLPRVSLTRPERLPDELAVGLMQLALGVVGAAAIIWGLGR